MRRIAAGEVRIHSCQRHDGQPRRVGHGWLRGVALEQRAEFAVRDPIDDSSLDVHRPACEPKYVEKLIQDVPVFVRRPREGEGKDDHDTGQGKSGIAVGLIQTSGDLAETGHSPGLMCLGGSDVVVFRRAGGAVEAQVQGGESQDAVHQEWVAHGFPRHDALPDSLYRCISRDRAVCGRTPLHHQLEVLNVELPGGIGRGDGVHDDAVFSENPGVHVGRGGGAGWGKGRGGGARLDPRPDQGVGGGNILTYYVVAGAMGALGVFVGALHPGPISIYEGDTGPPVPI